MQSNVDKGMAVIFIGKSEKQATTAFNTLIMITFSTTYCEDGLTGTGIKHRKLETGFCQRCLYYINPPVIMIKSTITKKGNAGLSCRDMTHIVSNGLTSALFF